MSLRIGPADKNGEWVGHRVAVAVKPAKRENQLTMLSSGFWPFPCHCFQALGGVRSFSQRLQEVKIIDALSGVC